MRDKCKSQTPEREIEHFAYVGEQEGATLRLRLYVHNINMIYNVVLQSSIGAGGAASEQFYYDWSQLEDAEYKVSFSFSCPVVNLTNTAIATIYVDLGQSQNKIAQAQNASSIIYKGSYLGSLLYTPYGANGYLYADIATNPMTYLAGRPRNKNF